MIVTKIESLDKKRSRVWIDMEFAFVLYKGELRHFNISEGVEIGEDVYHQILNDILPKRAKMRAMNLLQKKAYSEAELRRKLVLGEYPAGIIEQAIEYVSSYKYIDDRRLAEDYVRIHIGDKSKQRIIADLLSKGIHKDVISSAIENNKEEGFEIDEVVQARRLLEKRDYYNQIASLREDASSEAFDCMSKLNAKTYSFLLRKGFRADVVGEVMGLNCLT